jgi:CHAD domain-containing protein
MIPLRLELSLDPDDVPRFAGTLGLARERPRARPARLRIVWHDTAVQALAGAGLSLAERRHGHATLWRLERTRPNGTSPWVPGTPPPVLAEAADLAALPSMLDGAVSPGLLMPVAAFDGELRDLGAGKVAVTLLTGVLRAVAGERRVCRVYLDGEPGAVAPMARATAGTVRLGVPALTLAGEAYAMARPVRDARLVPPELSPDLSVGDAFARILGHLADAILRDAPRAAAGEAPEPVHNMRVALRRLRSAITLFRRAVGCAELDEVIRALKSLAKNLGPARDWDVFTSGIGARVSTMFADDKAVARLAARARRRRESAYAALRHYLEGAEFRQLGLTLAIVAASRPWEPALPPSDDATAADGAPSDAATEDGVATVGDTAPPAASAPVVVERPARALAAFAVRALRKRHARLLAPGAEIGSLPTADLHAIRLDAKRMRYAAEFFAPLFPGRHTRRFLRRLAALQERLGHLNDGAVAAALLAEIGQNRTYAGGAVLGAVAAGADGTRTKIERSWHKFRRLDGFWA